MNNLAESKPLYYQNTNFNSFQTQSYPQNTNLGNAQGFSLNYPNAAKTTTSNNTNAFSLNISLNSGVLYT